VEIHNKINNYKTKHKIVTNQTTEIIDVFFISKHNVLHEQEIPDCIEVKVKKV